MSCALLGERGPHTLFSDDFIWIVYSLTGCWSQSDLTTKLTEYFLLCVGCNRFIIDAIYQKGRENRCRHTVACTAPLVVGGGSVAVLSVSSAFRKFPPSLSFFCRCARLHLSADRHIWNIPLPFCSLVVKCIVRNTAELHVFTQVFLELLWRSEHRDLIQS